MKFYGALKRPHSTAPFDIFPALRKPFILLNFTFYAHFIHTMFETDKRCRRIRGEKRAVEQKKRTQKINFTYLSACLHLLLLLLFHPVLFFFPLPPYNAILCVICHNHLAALSLLYFFVPLTPSTLIMLFRTTHHSSSSPNSKHQVIFFFFSPNACVHINDSNGSVCILCLFYAFSPTYP